MTSHGLHEGSVMSCYMPYFTCNMVHCLYVESETFWYWRSGSGSGSVHCRGHFCNSHFCNRTGRAQCKRKMCPLAGVICTICYWTGLMKNWLKTFLLWLPMHGRQPLVALCLLLMKMQWHSLQWPHCLPACSSQQQFLQRMSSCTAQSCCPESWSQMSCRIARYIHVICSTAYVLTLRLSDTVEPYRYKCRHVGLGRRQCCRQVKGDKSYITAALCQPYGMLNSPGSGSWLFC